MEYFNKLIDGEDKIGDLLFESLDDFKSKYNYLEPSDREKLGDELFRMCFDKDTWGMTDNEKAFLRTSDLSTIRKTNEGD